MEKKAKEDKSAQGSGQGEPAAEGEPQGQDTAPEATPDSQGASDAPEQDSGSTESSSGEVPNGYVYKSKKGNSYFKKNGQWFNSATKQPINSSSVPMLERAAQGEIAKFNSSSPKLVKNSNLRKVLLTVMLVVIALFLIMENFFHQIQHKKY